MKRSTCPWIIALILCFVVPAASAGTLAPDLEAELQRASGDEIIEVIVQMDEQADLEPLKGERQTILTTLRETATRVQGPLIALLDELAASDVRVTYRSYWVINAVVVNGPREAIERIASAPGVGTVFLSSEIAPPELPPSTDAPKSLRQDSYTWGLETIRADEVHHGNPVYDGTGVIIGSIDTGVDATHPTIANKMATIGDGFTPGWFDANAGSPLPLDTHGHGTHTIGTMVGNNTNSLQLQIGVAPGAEYYACRIFGPNRTTLAMTLTAGQWMMDPDGVPGTDDAPDVINNSWGIAESTDTWYWDMVDSWRAAGIFPVFSIGNSGPNSETTGSPGNYPQSVGVGATDIHDAIAVFSSRGPVTYDTIEYVKPDVSAPGVDVISARATGTNMYGDNSYIVGPGQDLYRSNGTSMAAPHVAGTVALMLQQDPSLDVDALQRKLEASCLDLGGPGKDNSFGWGRIDAVDAVRDPYVYSSAADGGPQSLFITRPGADLYCSAGQLASGQQVHIYVVNNDDTWISSQTIPADVSGGHENYTANTAGELTGVPIWSGPIPEGDYDIVLDANRDGIWTPGVDALDHLDRAGCRALGEVLLGSYDFPRRPDTSHFVDVTPGAHLRLHTDSGGCRNFYVKENGTIMVDEAYWTDIYYTPTTSQIEMRGWSLTAPMTVDLYETVVPNASHTPALTGRQDSPSVLVYYEGEDGQATITEDTAPSGIPYEVGYTWSITFNQDILYGVLSFPVPAGTQDPEQLRLWREDAPDDWTLVDRTPTLIAEARGDTVVFHVDELGDFQLAEEPVVLATDDMGVDLELIWIGEPVYATGQNLPAGQDIDLYLMPEDGLLIPGLSLTDTTGGIETATTDLDGNLPLTEIWSGALAGHWRMVVDVNQDGFYDAEDALDNPVVHAFVVSEDYGIEAHNFEADPGDRSPDAPVIITGFGFNAYAFSYLELYLVEGTVGEGAPIPARVPFSETQVYIDGMGIIVDPVGNRSMGAIVMLYPIQFDTTYTIIVDVDGDGVFSSTRDRKVQGQFAPTGIDPDDGDIPGRSYLSQNHPNPFNPRTTIKYGLSKPADVRLEVYDVAGRLVRVLKDGVPEAPGRHEAVWNGRDRLDRPVAAGLYFYRLEAGDFVQTLRMMFVK